MEKGLSSDMKGVEVMAIGKHSNPPRCALVTRRRKKENKKPPGKNLFSEETMATKNAIKRSIEYKKKRYIKS